MMENDFPVPGMTKKPYGLPLMLEAWRGCVAFAAGNEDLRLRFCDECSDEVKAIMAKGVARSPIEKMIDSACGFDRDSHRGSKVFAEFCDWVTVNLWGEEDKD